MSSEVDGRAILNAINANDRLPRIVGFWQSVVAMFRVIFHLDMDMLRAVMPIMLRIFVAMRMALVEALLAVEHHEIHAEGVESGDEYAERDGDIGEV